MQVSHKQMMTPPPLAKGKRTLEDYFLEKSQTLFHHKRCSRRHKHRRYCWTPAEGEEEEDLTEESASETETDSNHKANESDFSQRFRHALKVYMQRNKSGLLSAKHTQASKKKWSRGGDKKQRARFCKERTKRE